MPPALGDEERVARPQIRPELARVDEGRGVERRRVFCRRRVARDRRVRRPHVNELPPDDMTQIIRVAVVMERRRGTAGRHPGGDDGLEASLRAWPERDGLLNEARPGPGVSRQLLALLEERVLCLRACRVDGVAGRATRWTPGRAR